MESSGLSSLGAPAVSVVLSTLGNYEVLERVLDGYSDQDAPAGSFEVLVVMDLSEPDPQAVLKAIGSRPYPVRTLSPDVPGLSANRNAGWRAARAQIVLFTDNDTIPVRRFVSEHLRWHESNPDQEAAVVGKVRWAPELEVTPFMRWLDTGLQFNFANIEPGDVPWGCFVGANSSIKKAFIDRVGDFDELRLPYGCEDTDWAYRASKLGMRLLYNDRALVDHLRPMTFDFYKRRIRRVAAAERQLSLLHPELPPWWYRIFRDVSRLPPVRGRGLRVARFVPRGTPWLGPRVWESVDMAYKQALAPHFLSAWNAAEAAGAVPSQPDLSEWESEGSRGGASSGPK